MNRERAKEWSHADRRKSCGLESSRLGIEVRRPQRWDVSFGREMSEADVDRLLARPPFCHIDASRFPEATPLRGILRNDTRILRLKEGDIVVREGDWGQSAFFVLSGAVRIVISPPGLPAGMLGRREADRKGWFQSLAQLWRNSELPEVRDIAQFRSDGRVGVRQEGEDEARIFLEDVPTILEKYETRRLYAGQVKEGDLFGEIAALGRTERTATVFAEGETELLEIRWQGLRELRRRDDALRDHIDKVYRERSLAVQLRHTPLFAHLSDEAILNVAVQTVFETYGEYDWYGSFKEMVSEDAGTRLEREPLIADEGHYPNGVKVIRSGFARMSRQFGNGHRTVNYLGRGQVYGLQEAAHNWRTGQQAAWQYSLRAIGHVHMLCIPTAVIEEFVLPTLPADQMPALIAAPSPTEGAAGGYDTGIAPGMLEFLADRRFINGKATMLIDMDRCTRCDDCVRACAEAHDGSPRFIRHGARHGRFMVANACMHCADPVCMIGCPTGAIHRDRYRGQVVINDATCIGCSTCANNCPYHNIRMVEARDRNGQFILDEHTHWPIQKATKCDLCVDQLGGPACQRACPHDALKRVDMSDLQSLASWINR
ncbi:MAG: cyclic nucleotide-binding domain-containing protein [Phycisphaerales bacterium]|nr:cyclic nucleotide-binding domain-containing protein [Phycisphaerales bacterium]